MVVSQSSPHIAGLRAALVRALIAAALAPAGVLGAEPTVAPTDATEPGVAAANPEEIAAWVRQLDDDRFAARETAQQRLLDLGPLALDAVGEAAAGGALESSTRAVSILLFWAQSKDSSLSLEALERLAALTNRPAESAMAAERLAEVREVAAMEQIVALGGRVEFDRQVQVITGGVIAAMPLQVVIGPAWKGGGDGLDLISAVRRAITVSFHSAPIGERAVPHLTAIPQLQRIEFYGTAISEESIAKLREGLPNAIIDVRSGARLGIAGGQAVGVPGASIGEVQPGSAAERAGLLTEDIITDIDGVPVTDFETLTREIAKAQPGQSVALKVLRQSQPMDVTVKFDRWGDELPVNPGMPNPLGAAPIGAPQRVLINNRR